MLELVFLWKFIVMVVATGLLIGIILALVHLTVIGTHKLQARVSAIKSMDTQPALVSLPFLTKELFPQSEEPNTTA